MKESADVRCRVMGLVLAIVSLTAMGVLAKSAKGQEKPANPGMEKPATHDASADRLVLRWTSEHPATGAHVTVNGASINEKGVVTLAPGETRSGEVILRFELPAPLEKGEVEIPWLYISNAPRSFSLSASLDGKDYESLLPKPMKSGYRTVPHLKFALPSELKGYKRWWLRVAAAESSGKEQAATLGKLVVTCHMSRHLKERRFQQWRLCYVHPWVEADAAQLPVLLRRRLTKLALSGPRNDWLTGALAIAASAECEVVVALKLPPVLEKRVQLRVVGKVPFVDTGDTVWDPLLRRIDLPRAKSVLNHDQIKGFPRFRPEPKSPIFLWVTVDLRGMRAGVYRGSILVRDDYGNSQDVPLEISVLEADLPVENPLYCLAWQWWSNEAMVRDFVEHGINVAWVKHELAWNSGVKFLLFPFGPSFGGKPIDETRRREAKMKLDQICGLVKRVKVPKERWALNPFDEPSDKTAESVLAWGKLIKSLRPDVQLWYDPAWGIQADTHQNWTTTKGCLKIINPIVDIWCPYCWHLWDGSGAIGFMKSTRKPVWSYEIYGCTSRRPSVGREWMRAGPWVAWKYRLQGIGVFAANDWRVDVWRGRVGKARNYSFVYPPGPDGRPISSRGYEALRQGVQEYKRLHVLKRLGADTKLLDALVDVAISPEGVGKSVEVFDSVREQLDRMLVALQGKRKEAVEGREALR